MIWKRFILSLCCAACIPCMAFAQDDPFGFDSDDPFDFDSDDPFDFGDRRDVDGKPKEPAPPPVPPPPGTITKIFPVQPSAFEAIIENSFEDVKSQNDFIDLGGRSVATRRNNIRTFFEDMGVPFNKEAEVLHLTREGGHSHRRIVHGKLHLREVQLRELECGHFDSRR